MTLYQYKFLKEAEQKRLLWSKGVFVDDRSVRKTKFLLYQLDSFYVEVRYDPTRNRIEALRIFSSTEQLEPYLRRIKLPRL